MCRKFLVQKLLTVFIVSFSPSLAVSETEAIAEVNTSTSVDPVLVILLTISLLVSVFALWVAYKFYRWRTQIDVTGALVPEHWAQNITNLTDAIKSFRDVLEQHLQTNVEQNQNFSKAQNSITSKTNTISETLQVTQDMLLKFQQTIDMKDSEIARLKQGYDTKILKKNILGMINVHTQMIAMLSNDPENKNLKNIEFLMRDEIENSGVEIKKAPLGEDFAKLSDYVEVVGHTSDSNVDLVKGQISDAVSEIYLMRTEDQLEVLRKAKVKYHLPQEDADD